MLGMNGVEDCGTYKSVESQELRHGKDRSEIRKRKRCDPATVGEDETRI